MAKRSKRRRRLGTSQLSPTSQAVSAGVTMAAMAVRRCIRDERTDKRRLGCIRDALGVDKLD